jgi:hypothetical protein
MVLREITDSSYVCNIIYYDCQTVLPSCLSLALGAQAEEAKIAEVIKADDLSILSELLRRSLAW